MFIQEIIRSQEGLLLNRTSYSNKQQLKKRSERGAFFLYVFNVKSKKTLSEVLFCLSVKSDRL